MQSWSPSLANYPKAELVFDQGGLVRLIIIDSIIALFRVDYSGRGELAERQQCLAQVRYFGHGPIPVDR